MTCAPALIVTVDTEEEGLWGATYKANGHTVRNVDGIERFQEACEQGGVRPTYLVDTPIVEDDRAVEILRGLQDAGRCEVGAHLHPWCAPPTNGALGPRESFMCNLPEALQREKLTRLTDRIEERCGRRPTSFRAGRYGLDMMGVRILSRLGYLVDSSVIPFSDFSAQGGPNYEPAPFVPYYLDGADIARPHAEGLLLEVPVSVGFNRVPFARAARLRSIASHRALQPLRTVGMLDRMGVLQRIKFSPEQADAARMKCLVDAYMRQQAPSMVMMLHSSSLVPGLSPYVPDEGRLARFYDDLAETFDHCRNGWAMRAETLTSFATVYVDRRKPLTLSSPQRREGLSDSRVKLSSFA